MTRTVSPKVVKTYMKYKIKIDIAKTKKTQQGISCLITQGINVVQSNIIAFLLYPNNYKYNHNYQVP